MSNRKRRLFPERPFSTLDFVASGEDESRDGRVGPLGAIPVPSQESAVIEDLLYCFIGIEGSHLKPARTGPSNTLVIQADPTLDPSLRELLHRITPLCQYYSTVVQFCEEMALPGAGRVNQALSGALYILLKDYYIFVTQLESQHRQAGDLTLNKVWFFVQPTLATMSMLAEVCRTIQQCDARGGKTLSLLHQHLVKE